MKLYNDTEKELFFEDYKPLNSTGLLRENMESLLELKENLEAAFDNAYSYHSELLAMAIETDYHKLELYIRMKEKLLAKEKGSYNRK